MDTSTATLTLIGFILFFYQGYFLGMKEGKRVNTNEKIDQMIEQLV